MAVPEKGDIVTALTAPQIEELIFVWELQADTDKSDKPGRREALRECADTLRMLVTGSTPIELNTSDMFGQMPRVAQPEAPAEPSGLVRATHAANSKLVGDYLHDYEMDDGEHCPYRPNEAEALLIADAVYGLLADDEFVSTFNAWQDAVRALNTPPAAEVEERRELSEDEQRTAFMLWYDRETGKPATLKNARYFAFSKEAELAFRAWLAASKEKAS